MLDLSFSLPIAVRDAALKLVAQGPASSINKEYYAQNCEGGMDAGTGVLAEYEKTDDRARELLKRLAASEPYYKRRRGGGADNHNNNGEGRSSGSGSGYGGGGGGGVGPIRNHRGGGRGGRGGGNGGGPNRARGGRFPGVGQLPPGPQDILPPDDVTITSLFLTGFVSPLTPLFLLNSFG